MHFSSILSRVSAPGGDTIKERRHAIDGKRPALTLRAPTKPNGPETVLQIIAVTEQDIISVHAEGASTIHLHRTVNQIKDLGCKAGVVLNPGTPPECLEYVLDCVDLILVMSVNPGFGGQSFIESQVEKNAKIKAMCDAKGVNPWIEVDGGVSPANAYKVIDAGANALVAGSAVFNSDDYAAAIAGIKASKAPK